jgi:hypothetical protein
MSRADFNSKLTKQVADFGNEVQTEGRTMKQMTLTLGAAASALALSLAQPALADETPRQTGRVTYTECRKSAGTTGLAIGGVAGALIGGGIFGGLLGPLLGAAGGAFAGRAIDRDSTKAKRCRSIRQEDTYQQDQRYETQRYNDQYQPSGQGYEPSGQTYQPQSYEPSSQSYQPSRPIRDEDRDLVQPERS